MLLAAFLVFGSAAGQTRKFTLTGVVREAGKKEGLFGAVVLLDGTQTGTQTDFEGKYRLSLPAGQNLTIRIRNLGFVSRTLTLRPVPEGEIRTLDVDLEEEVRQNKEVTVSVLRRRDTDVSLISDLKKADMVVNGVSSEQIARTQDRDAAQVISRIPGVTIIDNRFVMIRGINERYNAVMINEAISPGTEIDTRAFSFDLISSSMIERMVIYKSGSASLPGEFAGGVVKISTRSTFGENFIQVTAGNSFRQATSLATGYRPEGSSTDFLGFDNGHRALPASFPSSDAYKQMSISQQQPFARSLNAAFGQQRYPVMPDLRLGINMGRRFSVGKGSLSTVSSLNYSSSFQNLQVNRYRYSSYNSATGRHQDTLFRYSDNSYTRNVRVSAISNWLYRKGNTRIELKNLFSQMGDNETVIRTGWLNDRPGDLFRSASYNYLSRTLLSSQLLGQQELTRGRVIDWVAAWNFTHRNQPDYRRVRTFRQESSSDPYQLIPAAGPGGLDETGRFFSVLKEYVGMAAFNWKSEFRLPWDTARAIFRAGTYQEIKNRRFDARFFAYVLRNAANQQVLFLPLENLFSPQNISSSAFSLQEGTRPQDSYQASNFLAAAYAETTIPLSRFRFTLGVRPEFNRQMLQSGTDGGPVRVNNPIFSPLFFFNTSWELHPRWVMRAAYSKTVNRPEFRELAPFVYYDFNLDANFAGNPGLKVATIHNLDWRMEFYPGKSEIISVGGFYKRFLNPIETKISVVGLAPQFNYSNALSAGNYGIELEVRKGLGVPGGDRLADRVFVVANASLIHSRVDLGVVGSQERIRSLQGQSPYVVNTGLYYADAGNKVNLTLLYNVFGKRIFMVGDDLFPTIYEMPRHVIDLSASVQLSRRVSLRAAASDILNYQTRFLQDSNRDGRIGGNDESVFGFRRGSCFSLAGVFSL